MPITWNPVDAIDEPQSPYPNNQHFSFDQLTLTHSRAWRLQFSWNPSGPPINVNGPFNLRMYYTDDHVHATEADFAHRPIDIISASGFKVGDTIYIAYHKQIAANTWQICLNTFSVATRLWGTEISGGPTVTDAVGRRALYMTVRSGVRYILYNYFDGAIKVGWIKYDGGWSATTQVSGAEAGNTKLPNGIFLDGTLIHFWFKSGSTFPSVAMHLYHRTLSDVEALSATQDLGQLEPSWEEIYPGPAVIFEGKIMVPYPRNTGVPSTDPANPGNLHVPALFIGDPHGVASPTWTSEDVSTTICDWNALGEGGAYSVGATVTPFLGPKLYVFWVTPQHLFDTMNQLIQSWRMEGFSEWNETVLFAPTQPTNPELDDWLHNPDAITLEWQGEVFIIIDRVNASFQSQFGNEYGESGFVSPPPTPPPPPGPGQLGVCRTILHLFQHAVSPQVEITKDRKGDWTECGTPSYKFFQGVKIDADTFAVAKSLQIRDSDTGTLHLLQPATITHSGRQILPYSFATPFKAHTVRDEPQDMVPWRNFGLEYIWEPTPESVQTWKTQWTAHGFNGYMHICRIDAAWESTAAVTLTILSFDGMSPTPLTLPSTSGAEQKLLLTLTPNKGQAYQYTATSTGRFRLFLNDWIVWVGPWGRQGPYVAYRLLGGEIGDKAKI